MAEHENAIGDSHPDPGLQYFRSPGPLADGDHQSQQDLQRDVQEEQLHPESVDAIDSPREEAVLTLHVWVQVAKNFEPFIRLTEEEVREELLDFEENISFDASELGVGQHKISAEAYASWQKHEYTESDNIKNHSKEIQINID